MGDPIRVYAFDALAAPMQAVAPAAPGVTIAPRHPAAMFDVRGDPHDAQFVRSASEILGAALPLVAGTAASAGDARALWLGPDEWLLVYAEQPLATIGMRIANGTFTDVTHARAVLRIGGRCVRETLAKICPLDFHARQFPVGACARTAVAKINAIVDHVEPDVFDLYCSRSYARSFWHAMTEAAAEYGCNVEPPRY